MVLSPKWFALAIKHKEINAVQDCIESKMVRSGEIALQYVEQLHDLDDATEDLVPIKNKDSMLSKTPSSQR